MNYIKTYKSFIYSNSFNEGVRITTGILLPALLFHYFDMLSTGIVLSLGASFVSIPDSPGPVQHRRNSMLVCCVVIFGVATLTGFINAHSFFFGIFLFAACFIFSIIGIYGTRAASIGIAALVVLVLNIERQRQGWQIVGHSFYLLCGGIWYMCYSLLLYTFRPYKLLQQSLGESIQGIADYLRIRADFYKRNADYDAIYRQLLHQQSYLQEKQEALGNLIFNTRQIVKESTHTSRVLVMIFLDTADMFERIMTSYQSYAVLHDYFDETDILEKYHSLILQIASELDEIGIAIKSGRSYDRVSTLSDNIKRVREERDLLRTTYLKPDNIEGFINLRGILENIQDLADRLQTLRRYSTYDHSIKKKSHHDIDYKTFISHDTVSVQLLLDNLTMKSDIFRHSLRVSIAAIAGYVVSFFFTIGHSYWILLTLIVILKPAYSLTKKRNGDRLFGTILGVIAGALILRFIQNNSTLLVIMVLFMTAYYSFMRRNYFITILLMTPYVIIFFHLLYPEEFKAVVTDRIVDTMIGSAIALAASFLFPAWERTKFRPLMIQMLESVVEYFSIISEGFTGKTISGHQRQVGRKKTLVALANLSAAFNRMLSEPKSQQKSMEQIHQFVVLNHMFTSYIATLSSYFKLNEVHDAPLEMQKAVTHIREHLVKTIKQLKGEEVPADMVNEKASLQKLNEEADELLEKRKQELKRGQLESSTKNLLFDLKSVVDQLNLVHNVAIDLEKVSKTITV